jgi:prophage regulatory protein
MSRHLPARFRTSVRERPSADAVDFHEQERGAGQTPDVGRAGIHAQPAVPPRLLRFPDVRERTGLSRSTIWRLERQGQFPRHRRISSNAVAWFEEEITAWIRGKISS